MLKVNGVAIPTPKTCSMGINDLDGESHRVASGRMIRDRVAVKRKIEIEYGVLEWEQASLILKAISPVFVLVEFPDPQEGKMVTKEMYAGDKTSPVMKIKDGKVTWEGLKFNLVER